MKLLILLLLAASVACPATGQEFVCPVVSVGCTSYKELVNARDEGVISDVKYVCFRESVDEFFVVKVHAPLALSYSAFWYKWNSKLADYELSYDRRALGIVQLQTFQNGVANETTMPSIYAFGKWAAVVDSFSYVA